MTVTSIGKRSRKRKTWKGSETPEGCVGIGRKGAMPEPGGGHFAALRRHWEGMMAYLYLDTESTSPSLSATPAVETLEILLEGQTVM